MEINAGVDKLGVGADVRKRAAADDCHEVGGGDVLGVV